MRCWISGWVSNVSTRDLAKRRRHTGRRMICADYKRLSLRPIPIFWLKRGCLVEMSQSSWLVGGVLPGIERQPRKKLEPALDQHVEDLAQWLLARQGARPSRRAFSRPRSVAPRKSEGLPQGQPSGAEPNLDFGDLLPTIRRGPAGDAGVISIEDPPARLCCCHSDTSEVGRISQRF